MDKYPARWIGLVMVVVALSVSFGVGRSPSSGVSPVIEDALRLLEAAGARP
jgi:hypothetical protein